MKGLGSLQTPADLLRKLEHDLLRFEEAPANSEIAFDLFVTAYHMKDWVDANNNAAPEKWLEREPLLGIAGHIANGAKHYEAVKWKQVKASKVEGGVWADIWKDIWAKGTWKEDELIFILSEADAKEFQAPQISAIEVARRLTAFWRDVLRPANLAPPLDV